VDDLAAWLTQIWDEAEKAARFTIELTEHSYPADEFQIHWGWSRLTNHRTNGSGGASMALGAPSPTEVLARIAADRQILTQYTWAEKTCARLDTTRTMEIGVVASLAQWRTLERVIRLLALPHADRPGYQEAWKPEA
jgi:hypothetical protein